MRLLRATHAGVVERLSFACMMTSCNGRGGMLRVPFLLIKKWVSLGILRLLDHIDIDSVLAFVAIARLCKVEVDWTALGDQLYFSYEYDKGVLVVLRVAEPLKCLLPNGTEVRYNGGKEIRWTYLKKYEPSRVTKTFARAASPRYIDS